MGDLTVLILIIAAYRLIIKAALKKGKSKKSLIN